MRYVRPKCDIHQRHRITNVCRLATMLLFMFRPVYSSTDQTFDKKHRSFKSCDIFGDSFHHGLERTFCLLYIIRVQMVNYNQCRYKQAKSLRCERYTLMCAAFTHRHFPIQLVKLYELYVCVVSRVCVQHCTSNTCDVINGTGSSVLMRAGRWHDIQFDPGCDFRTFYLYIMISTPYALEVATHGSIQVNH